ncbi:MAG: hypothetical protein ACUVRG_09310 [Ignavibacterium sp.]|uniref:hypothetical protein n=1 Tax=Ignavibacterium sp. TaxID=2651167 RepID=UPI004049E965
MIWYKISFPSYVTNGRSHKTFIKEFSKLWKVFGKLEGMAIYELEYDLDAQGVIYALISDEGINNLFPLSLKKFTPILIKATSVKLRKIKIEVFS